MRNSGNQFVLEELRHGTQLLYRSDEGKLLATLDWQDLQWAHDKFDDFVNAHSPIVLDESILSKAILHLDKKINPKAFENKNNSFLYHTPDNDGRILYVCRVYTKEEIPEAIGWDVGLGRTDSDIIHIVSLRHIIDNPLLYFHQLQNIFLDLFNINLRI